MYDLKRRGWISRLHLLVCLSSLVISELTHAAPVPGLIRIQAEGYAKGHGPDARDAAVADGTEQALRVWVESILGERADRRFLPIIESTDGYAQSSRLLELEHDEIGTHVLVEVYLYEEALRVDMAAILMQTFPKPPRVVLLVGERIAPEDAEHFDPDGHTVGYLSEALRTVGIEVVNASDVRSRYTERELRTYLGGGYESIARFGRENSADVVLAGRVFAGTHEVNARTHTLRAHADLKLEVVQSHGGLVYEKTATEAEVSCRVAANGVRMAMEDATYKARSAVLVGTVLAAVRPASEMPKFELRIENARGWEEIERVAQRLRQFDSLEKVEVLRSQEGAGIIHFEYAGKMGALVRYLSAPFSDGRVMDTQHVVGDELIFRFRDR